jgi:hypothetical protein
MPASRRGDETSPYRPARPRRRTTYPDLSFTATLHPAPASSWPGWTDRVVFGAEVDPGAWPEWTGRVRVTKRRLEPRDLPAVTIDPAADAELPLFATPSTEQ